MKRIFKLIISILFITSLSCVYATPENMQVTHGLNTFVFNLYKQAHTKDANNVMSPYSFSSLLAILVNGAAGKTRAQLLQVLNLSAAEINAANAMADTLTANSHDLLIANALWADKRFNYKKSFTDLIAHDNANHFFIEDFVKKPELAVNAINSWVNSNTHGYIPAIISLENIGPQTKLILTNAIYFKGVWQLPFKKTDTLTKPFTTSTGKSQAAMMHQQKEFYYTEDATVQALLLTYAKSNLALAVILPKSNQTLAQVQQSLNADSFVKLMKGMKEEQVNVNVPRFKIESTYTNLAQGVQALGLTTAFSEQADFTNLSDNPLSISQIIQKALIQVDEQGTVAAAATSMMMMATAMYHPPKPVIEFNANHPFLFVLYDTVTGLILFIGQVTNPSVA